MIEFPHTDKKNLTIFHIYCSVAVFIIYSHLLIFNVLLICPQRIGDE